LLLLSGAAHTDIFLTYEQINALSPDKKEKWLSLAYQVDDNLMCGFDPDKEPIYEELIVSTARYMGIQLALLSTFVRMSVFGLV
jgi:hypothetical protein